MVPVTNMRYESIFVSYINCYAWYLILMTFKMYFYINIIKYVFSLTIILNLRGQKLKSNIGSVFPKDIAMLNSFRAPQADPGVCLLFWSSFMNICIFSLFSFSRPFSFCHIFLLIATNHSLTSSTAACIVNAYPRQARRPRRSF